jgi:hypothetical protein
VEAEVDSSSRGQKDFICEGEKSKAAWRHTAGPRNLWSCGQVGNWVFIAFSYFPRAEMSLRCKQSVSWEGELSPWPIITFCDLLHPALQKNLKVL